MNPFRKLLVVHPGALGDLVLTFPILLALRKQFDSLDILCGAGQGALAVHLGIADQWFWRESARFSGLYQPSISDPELSEFMKKYDDVLLFSLSESPEAAIRSVPGPRVWRIPPRPPVGRRIHVIDFIQNEMKNAGWELAPETMPGGKKSSSGSVFLHPGSGSPRKNWDLDGFLAVSKALRAHGFPTEFLMGPAESAWKAAVLDRGEDVLAPESLVALAERLEGAAGLIGNDSGASHLAAFLGLPTVAIFGPSDPARWRPSGLRVAVVAGSAPICPACFEEPERPECVDRPCLAGISPESVINAFFSVFSPSP
ncbi:MAG: glycosyltransferase family 9 protein [Desulfococcaceae bacterium]